MQHIEVLKSTYLDSVSLMRISKTAGETPGVDHAVVSMGTDTNINLMRDIGFDLEAAGKISANDLVIAVDAESEDVLDRVMEVVSKEIKGGPRRAEEARAPRSLEAAVLEKPEINLVLISVPGPYAAYEARKALAAGRHVMIFSDNVPIEDEKDLKAIGTAKGLLVMGPDCGTAVIGGVGLGFANDVPGGRIGMVSASGTGAQEVSSILARLGLGTSHIIGTGGRDVSREIGAATMKLGLKALIEDEATEVLVVISKEPDLAVGQEILGLAAGAGKPCVVYFAGGAGEGETGNLIFAKTLTDTAVRAAGALTGEQYDPLSIGERQAVAAGKQRRPGAGRFLRGLFSGGTLAQEAIFLLGPSLGSIHTNMHMGSAPALGDPAVSEGHTILDLGDDVFTRGRAHPMIDQAQRLARLTREAEDPETGVILLDVVLGYGCNDDPGGEIAAALKEIGRGKGPGGRVPAVVASICGTHGDPQGYDRQKRSLESAGVMLAPTNALACEVVLDMLAGDSNG